MTVKIYAHGLPITAYIRIAYHLSVDTCRNPLYVDGGEEKGRRSREKIVYCFVLTAQRLLLMYDVRANKKSWTRLIHIPASLINTTILSAVEAMKVEDQNAIKIDDYGENILRLHPHQSLAPSSQRRLIKASFGGHSF